MAAPLSRSLPWLLVATLVAVGVCSLRLAPRQASRSSTGDSETVVLLHGLGRTNLSMWRLASALREQGYSVLNLDYPSRRRSIDQLAEFLASQIDRCCRESPRIHFVTHSLGGIVLRYFLDGHEVDSLGRVVMLSPPSGGSELVDHLREYSVFREVLGPTAEWLGTDSESLPSQLGPVDFELGVITGESSLNPLFSWLIPGPDDGTVSVESAQTPGMSDFLVVPYGHTFIMSRQAVIDQTIHFLEHGRFVHPPANGT